MTVRAKRHAVGFWAFAVFTVVAYAVVADSEAGNATSDTPALFLSIAWMCSLPIFAVWAYRTWRDARAGLVRPPSARVAALWESVRERQAAIAVAVSIAAIAAFACFVWPTPYRQASLPEDMSRSNLGALCCYGARVNRVTSKVQVLTIVGWMPAEDAAVFANR